MSSINVQQLKELIKNEPNLVLIDIRTKDEVVEGRIPNAEWMDMSDKDFMSNVAILPKDKTYCLYCASGGRSSMAAPFMETNGFSHVYDLRGGIGAWVAEGGEVV